MTQEDKELLLKDLCARLPYGVKIELMPITKGKCTILTPIILQDYFVSDDINYLPYLRPMSSMTEEEKKEFIDATDGELRYSEVFDVIKPLFASADFCASFDSYLKAVDWLNRNHFDYRGLIEKGLAIDCTGLNVY